MSQYFSKICENNQNVYVLNVKNGQFMATSDLEILDAIYCMQSTCAVAIKRPFVETKPLPLQQLLLDFCKS